MRVLGIMVLLFACAYGATIFVLENTNVEIECPLTPTDNLSWFYDETFLAVGKKINPQFGPRYSTSRHYKAKDYNLQITNFTDVDQGRYRCQGVYGGKYKQNEVNVKICEIPDEISAFKTVLNLHPGKKEIYKMNHVCFEDVKLDQLQTTSSEKVPTITMLKEAASNQTSVILNNREENQIVLRKYACLQTNYESCLTSNCTFPLNVEWRSSREKAGTVEYSSQNKRQDIELYICYINTSNLVEDVQSPNKIKLYRANKTLYFPNFNIVFGDYYHCESTDIDVLETSTLLDVKTNVSLNTVSEFPTMYDIIGMSLIGGIAVVVVLILSVKRALVQFKRADSLVRSNEAQNLQAEGYSSIDRRQRQETGQVSYRATLNQRCSIAKVKGCDLVHLPIIQTNGNKSVQLERTDNSDMLQMSTLRKTANAPKLVDANSRHNLKNPENPILNYIDVEFNSRKTTPSFFIHGSDQKTPYADIYLTLKADPLPESDSSDDDAADHKEVEEHNNDDFMTLEDIQELRETNMRT